MDKQNKKILITGGHLTPAVAVINELKTLGYNNFVWVGHKYNQSGAQTSSAEFNTIQNYNIPFIEFKTGKLIRDWGFDTFFYGIKNLILIVLGFFRAFKIVFSQKPDLVLSFGGYLALPIVISAKLLGKKVVTHEQTIVTGLANKVISKFADKILISWESSVKYFNKNKTIFTGNPIRSDVFEIKNTSLISSLDPNLDTILIYGGNQGSHEINTRIFDIAGDLVKDFNVIHQTGNSSVTKDNERSLHVKMTLDEGLRNRYVPTEYIVADQIGAVLDRASIIVGRSGANSISEILALGKLSILIPLPRTSHDEQIKNADLVSSTGLALVLPQSELNAGKLYQSILLLRNQLKIGKAINNLDLVAAQRKAKSLIKLNAAKEVAGIVVEML